MSGGSVDMLNFIGSPNFLNPFDNAMKITEKIQHICFMCRVSLFVFVRSLFAPQS